MTRPALLAGLFALLPAAAAAAGPYDDLLAHVPADSNTLLLADAKAAYASPLARAEKWAEKGTPDNRGGLGFVPRDAEAVVVAAGVNYSRTVRDFQVGLVRVHDVPTMRDVAAREGGTADEISGRLAVLSPRDVYFTTLSGSELVAVYPADRQFTARYLKAVAGKKTGELSQYLRKAAEAAAGNTVTVALDLEDVADRTLLRLSLPTSPTVAKVKGIDVDLLSKFLAGIKGMTFSAKVTDAVSGSLTVEFVGDPGRYRKTLPDLVRELLDGQGVAVDSIESWEAKFTETTLTLSGPMTTAELKRVVSLFAFPSPAGEPEAGAKENAPTAAATRRYLAAVGAVLADVRALKDSPKYEKTATWHDKAAAQIEQLSRRNVDPIALEAAAGAARRLHAIAQSLRGVPIDVRALEGQAFYYSRPSVGVMPGGPFGWQPFVYGPGLVETNVPSVQAEIARVVAADQKVRLQAWSDIQRGLADARRRLSEKYKTDF